MKPLSLLTGVFFASTLLAAPLARADDRAQRADAKLFISEVSLALMDADDQRLGTLENNVDNAEETLDALEQELIANPAFHIRFARLAYTSRSWADPAKQPRYVLIPFDNEDFDGVFDAQPEKMGIHRIDAHVVDRVVVIDVTKAASDIALVKQAIEANDTEKAAHGLQHILDADIGPSMVKKPELLQSSYDHLVLAKALLDEHQYDYSRLALSNARARLLRYGKAIKDDKHNDEIRGLGYEMLWISDELKREDPSTLDKVRVKINDWMDEIKEWMHVPVKQQKEMMEESRY